MSAHSSKKKRIGSRRRQANQNKERDEFHKADNIAEAQQRSPEENAESFNTVASLDNTTCELQDPLSMEPSGNRRKLGSSRRNKRGQHAKDLATESHHKLKEEAEEKIEGNETLKTTRTSVATQLEGQEELGDEREHDIVSTEHDSSSYSAPEPDDSSEIYTFSEIRHSEVDLESLNPQSENLKAVHNENVTNTELVSHSHNLLETILENNDKSDSFQREEVNDMADLHDILKLPSLGIGANVYSGMEKESENNDTDLVESDGNSLINYLTGKLHEESVDLQFSITPEKNTKEDNLIEQKGADDSVEKFPVAKDEISSNKEQEQIQNFFVVGDALYSEDGKTDHGQEMQNNYSCESVTYYAPKSSELLDGKPIVEAELSETHQPELAVKSTDGSATKEENSNPDYKVLNKQEEEEIVAEVEESKSSWQTFEPTVNPSLDSQAQDNPVAIEEQIHTDFHLIANTRKMSSSQRHKGQEPVKDPAAEPEVDILQSSEDNGAPEQIPMSLAIETSQEGLGQGREHDVIKPATHDSFVDSAVMCGFSHEVQKPFSHEARGGHNSDEMLYRADNREIKTEQMQEMPQTDQTPAGTIHDPTDTTELIFGKIINRSDVTDDSAAREEESSDESKHYEHYKKENTFEAFDHTNEDDHADDTETTLVSDTTKGQMLEIKITRGDDVKLSLKHTSQVKEGLFSKTEESDSSSQAMLSELHPLDDTEVKSIENADSVDESYDRPTVEVFVSASDNEDPESAKKSLAVDAVQEESMQTIPEEIGQATDQIKASSFVDISELKSYYQGSRVGQQISNQSNLVEMSENLPNVHSLTEKELEERAEDMESSKVDGDDGAPREKVFSNFSGLGSANHSDDPVNKVYEWEFNPTQTQDDDTETSTLISGQEIDAEDTYGFEVIVKDSDSSAANHYESNPDDKALNEHGKQEIISAGQETIDTMSQEDFSLCGDFDIIMPETPDSSFHTANMSGFSYEVQNKPSPNHQEAEMESQHYEEGEISFYIEASDVPLDPALEEMDKPDYLQNRGVPSLHYFDDAVNKMHEGEVETEPQNDNTSGTVLHVNRENFKILSENPTDQSEVIDRYQSVLIVQSPDDSAPQQKDLNPQDNRDEHSTKEETFTASQLQNMDNNNTKKPHISDNEREDSELRCQHKIDAIVDLKPSEKPNHQEKEGFYSEMKEREKTKHDVEMNASLDSKHQDNFLEKEEQSHTGFTGNRRKMGSSRRHKGRQQVKESAAEDEKDILQSSKGDNTQGCEHDVTISATHDSSVDAAIMSDYLSEVQKPTITNSQEAEMENVITKSKNLQQNHGERETGSEVEASDVSLGPIQEEIEKSDADSKVHEKEVEPENLQEEPQIDHLSENVLHDATGNLKTTFENLLDLADVNDQSQSVVTVHSPDDSAPQQEDSNPENNQDKHCIKEAFSAFKSPDYYSDTKKPHSGDIERVDRAQGQEYRTEVIVEGDFNPSDEQIVHWDTEGLHSEMKERDKNMYHVEMNLPQPQDDSVGIEEQTHTGFTGNRRKMGSSRRHKGRQQVKESAAEHEEDILQSSMDNEANEPEQVLLAVETSQEELTQGSENDVVISATHKISANSAIMSDYLSEVQKATITNSQEAELESLIPKSDTLQQNHEKGETDSEVVASNMALALTQEKIDKCDYLLSEEARDDHHHSEDAVNMMHQQEVEPEQMQEEPQIDHLSENVIEGATDDKNIISENLFHQTEVSDPYQTSQEELAQGHEHDVVISATHDSSDSAVLLSFPTKVLNPIGTTNHQEAELETLNPKSENLQQDHEEKETGSELEASVVSLGPMSEEMDISDYLLSEEARGDHHSEDTDSKVEEQEIEPENMQKELQIDHLSDNVTQDDTDNLKINSENCLDQAVDSDLYKSGLTVQSLDDSVPQQKDSNPENNQDECCTKKVFSASQLPNTHSDTKKLLISDTEREHSAQGQEGKTEVIVEDYFNPSDEREDNQDKEGGQVEEREKTTLHVEMNPPLVSQPQDNSVGSGEQTPTGFTGNRRKMGSSRRRKGRQQVTDSGAEHEEDILQSSMDNEAIEPVQMLLSTETSQGELAQGSEHDVVITATHYSSVDSPNFFNYLSEIQEPTQANSQEAELETLIPKSENLQQDHGETETDSEVKTSDMPLGSMQEKMNKSDRLLSKDTRDDHHSENALNKGHEAEVEPEQMQEEPQVDHLSENVLQDAVENMKIISEDGVDQSEVSDLYQSVGPVHTPEDCAPQQEDSNPESADFNPSNEQKGHQDKEGLHSELEEWEKTMHHVEMNPPLVSQPQDDSVGSREQTPTGFTGNRRKMGSSRRRKGRQQVTDSGAEHEEDILQRNKDNEVIEPVQMLRLKETSQGEFTQGSEHDVVIPAAQDSFVDSIVLPSFSNKVHNPIKTNSQAKLEVLIPKSENLQQDGGERETDFEVKASDVSLGPMSEDTDKSVHLPSEEARDDHHSEDAVNKGHEQEVQPEPMKEMPEIDHLSENVIQDATEISKIISDTLLEQSEVSDQYRSVLTVHSPDDSAPQQKDSNPENNQDEHCIKEEAFSASQWPNSCSDTKKLQVSDARRVDNAQGQECKTEVIVEDHFNPNDEQKAQQDKEGLQSEMEEREKNMHHVEMNPPVVSQPQGDSEGIEEQTPTGFTGNRRKMGSSRRRKGQQQVTDSGAEHEEDILQSSVGIVALKPEQMLLAIETSQEELTQGSEHDAIISATHNISVISANMSDYISEVQEPTITNSQEAELETWIPKSHTLKQNHGERETGSEVEASDVSSGPMKEEMDKYDHLVDVETRGSHHLEDTDHKVCRPEVKPEQVQEEPQIIPHPQNEFDDATESYELTDDFVAKDEDSNHDIKQNEPSRKEGHERSCVVKPGVELKSHQEKGGLFSEIGEKDSSSQGLQSEIHPPLGSQPENIHTDLKSHENRRKLGSSRRNKGRHHSPYKSTEGMTRNATDNESLETIEISLTNESEVHEKSMETMLVEIKKPDATQAEEFCHQESANVGISELSRSSLHSSFTVVQQLHSHSDSMEMPDETEKENKEREETPESTRHGENVLGNVVSESHETSENKQSIFTQEITTGNNSLKQHTEIVCSVEQPSISPSKEVLFPNEEEKERVNSSEVRVVLLSGDTENEEAQREDTHEVCDPSVQESESSLLTVQSEINAPNGTQQIQDHLHSVEEETHAGFKPKGNHKKFGSSRRSKGRQVVEETKPELDEEREDKTRDSEACETMKLSLAVETMEQTERTNLNPAESIRNIRSTSNEDDIKEKIPREGKILSQNDVENSIIETADMNLSPGKDDLIKSTEAEENNITNEGTVNDTVEMDLIESSVSGWTEASGVQNLSVQGEIEQEEAIQVQNSEPFSCEIDKGMNVQNTDDAIETVGEISMKHYNTEDKWFVDADASELVEVLQVENFEDRKVCCEINIFEEIAQAEMFSAANNKTDFPALLSTGLEEDIGAEQAVDSGNLPEKSTQKRRKLGSTRRALHKKHEKENEQGADENNLDKEINRASAAPSLDENPKPSLGPVYKEQQGTNETSSVEPSQLDDLTSTEMPPASLVAESSNSSVDVLPSTNSEVATHIDTTQSAQNDEERPKKGIITQDQALKSSAARLVTVENVEIEKYSLEQGAGQEHKDHESGTQKTNNMDQADNSANPDMKNPGPNLSPPHRRRKMGSTRRNLVPQTKGEDLHQKQEDNEATETVTQVKDAKTVSFSELKNQEILIDIEVKEDQRKEKVLLTVKTGESQSKPVAHTFEEITVSHRHLAETEHQLTPDHLPVTPSTSPKQDTMSEIASPGRRRKLGSHRRSRGAQSNENLMVEEEIITDTESRRDVTIDKTTERHSLGLDKILEVDESTIKALSNISDSKTGEHVSEKTPATVNPVPSPNAGIKLVPDNLNLALADQSSNSFNVVLVGDSSIGKTSYMKRAQSGKFSLEVPASIGLDTCKWTVLVDGKPVVLHLWDTAGQERFHSLTKQILHKAQAFLLMYDITSPQSFSAVSYWASCIEEGASENVTILLLGNKCDHADRRVQSQEGEALAKENGFEFMECSAATGENVIQSLETVARRLNERVDIREEASVLNKEPQRKKTSGCC